MTDESRSREPMESMTEFLFSPATPDVSDFHLVMEWIRAAEGKGALDRERRNQLLGLLSGLFLPPYEPKDDCLSMRSYMLGNVTGRKDPRYQWFVDDLTRLRNKSQDMGPIMARFTLDIRAEEKIEFHGRNVEVMLRDHMKHVDPAMPGAVQRLDFLRGRMRDLIGDSPYLGSY